MNWLWIILIGSLPLLSQAQDTQWQAHRELEIKAQRTLIDQLNSLYVVRQGEIVKFDAEGEEVARYSNKLIGEDILLDVTNPMKVILYSPDQMRLIFLDSRLGEMQEQINLFSVGYEQISLAATSHSNGVWLYDPIHFILIRMDQNMEEERRSLNLAQMLRLEFFPTSLVEVNNRVYLSDPQHGVFVFDIFGNFMRKIPIKDIDHLVVSDSHLFYVKGGVIYALHLRDSSEEEVKVEWPEGAFFDVNRNRIVFTAPSRVIIYAHKP